MNKPKLLFPFIVASVGALLTGKWYYEDKLEVHGQAAQAVFQEAKEERTLLNSLDPTYHPDQSFIDFLHYKALTENGAVIAVFGSSAAAGVGAVDPQQTWSRQLEKNLHERGKDFRTIRVQEHGFADYSTSQLVKEAKIKQVIDEQPALIIMETALFANFDQHVPIEQTTKDIAAIVQSLQTNVPTAKILLVSSPPISIVSEEKTENYIGLTYKDYVEETSRFIEKQGWAYVNLHEKINAHLEKDEELGASDILTDGVYLNEEGQKLWLSQLAAALEQ